LIVGAIVLSLYTRDGVLRRADGRQNHSAGAAYKSQAIWIVVSVIAAAA
jgi:hypothetical protein